jgi:nitrogen fixation/metabolism regulation signal transduction histidine kinase
MKSGFFDKLVDRLDHLDSGSLQTYFLRLAKEKGLMETIFQALEEGLIVLDPEARISFANRAAEQFLGFRLESAEGVPIERYLWISMKLNGVSWCAGNSKLPTPSTASWNFMSYRWRRSMNGRKGPWSSSAM